MSQEKNIVVVVNGKPRSGKDTFSKYVVNYCESKNKSCDVWSTIDIEKEILEEYVKSYDTNSDIDRSFLSDFKSLLNEYYNYTFDTFKSIIDYNDGITIIHSREWPEIESFRQYCEQNNVKFISVFISSLNENDNFTNYSDKYCDDFCSKYNYKIKNNGSLEELQENAKHFCESELF